MCAQTADAARNVETRGHVRPQHATVRINQQVYAWPLLCICNLWLLHGTSNLHHVCPFTPLSVCLSRLGLRCKDLHHNGQNIIGLSHRNLLSCGWHKICHNCRTSDSLRTSLFRFCGAKICISQLTWAVAINSALMLLCSPWYHSLAAVHFISVCYVLSIECLQSVVYFAFSFLTFNTQPAQNTSGTFSVTPSQSLLNRSVKSTTGPIERLGALQTLICAPGVRPKRCPTLSNPALWPSWMVVCPSFTLLMMLLFPGWPTVGLNRIHKKCA